MPERRVLRMGDPDLHRVAPPVEAFASAELEQLLVDLWDTMAARGGIGLAATQIGVLQRVVVFGVADSPRYPGAAPVPRSVLINPEIEPVGEALSEAWEGCLSVPGMRGLVERPERIVYRGFDAAGTPLEREVDGLHARVVQHEVDHLDGIVYPMRMRDLRQFGFEEELSLGGRLRQARCDDSAAGSERPKS